MRARGPGDDEVFAVPAPPSNEAQRLEFLYSCGILDTPRDERFDRITRLAAKHFGADVAFIGFVDEATQWMKSVSAEGVAPWIERERSVCQLVISSGEPLVIGDMWTDPRLEGHPVAPTIPLRFYAGVPLVTEDGLVLATLCILKRNPGDAEGFDVATLSDFAAIAMDELDLWRRNRELETLAETCPLTGVANRRGFDEALAKAVRRSRRTGLPMALLMLDMDHFKAVNDTYGHQAGDVALCTFAKVLRKAARRPDDVVARYGGEEFAVILPDCDAEGAVTVAESVRDLLRAAAIPNPRGADGKATTSLGIASVGENETVDADVLVSRADAALYIAKHSGRDRYAVAGRDTVPS